MDTHISDTPVYLRPPCVQGIVANVHQAPSLANPATLQNTIRDVRRINPQGCTYNQATNFGYIDIAPYFGNGTRP